MKLYRLYTEDRARHTIDEILQRRFSSYTVIPAFGVWANESEYSLIIEIIASELQETFVRECADAIKAVNEQSAIWLVIIDIQDEVL